MLVNRDTKFGIVIAIAVGMLILVTALAASAEPNYVQIDIYGKDQSVNENDKVNAEENDVNNDQSTNENPTQNNEDLDTNRDNADLESKDADKGQPETLETDRKTMLVKGIPDIERFLPTSKMASGDIVDVPTKGDPTEGNIASIGKMAPGDVVDPDDAIIVRSDPIDRESYIICASNHLSYQCVSHPYPEDTPSGD